jgi:dTDP-4-amino-4,6-dideoxygalactose transaminase
MASYTLPVGQLFRLHSAGKAVLGLEEELCRRFQVAAAACVPMARIGLWLGLLEMIRPGQTVVMSPLTIIDVVNMVLLAGGIPLFADISKASCGMDPDEAEALIDNRTGAVLITHLHGETSGAFVFREICRRYGLPLIEDTAQAFGASENGRRLGTIGDLGIYSFGFYKNVNAWRGGMVVSHDLDLIRRIHRRHDALQQLPDLQLLGIVLSGGLTELATWPPVFSRLVYPLLRYSHLKGIRAVNHHLDPEHRAVRLASIPAGYLYRMTEAQAQLALAQMDSVDPASQKRISNAALYDKGLHETDHLIKPRWSSDGSNTYTYYPVRCRERSTLLNYAMRHGRDFAAQHLRNCADLPEFRELCRDCPNARAAARELVLLPTYPGYPRAEIKQNIQVIQQFSSAGAQERMRQR